MTRDKSYLQKMARINADFTSIVNKVINEPKDKDSRQKLCDFACFLYNKLSEDYDTKVEDIIVHHCGLDDDTIVRKGV